MLPGLPQPHVVKLDCGSCRRCCQNDPLIVLTEDDDPALYRCHEIKGGLYALDRKPNGDCIYLGEQGCTIWGRHPQICRVFDCAAFVKRMDEGVFDAIGPRVDNEVAREGRRRLKQLESAK